MIDGQHRIAGLNKFEGESFDIPVSIFIGADIADQAQLFATVNLEQTKVSKSLAYDLYELSKTRSPQKTCHNIAVALDQDSDSALYHRIKRLGVATVDRVFEPITQATFVEGMLQYVTRDASSDRDMLLRGKKLQKENIADLQKTSLRNLFIQENDLDIGEIFFNYFAAVAKRWPVAWNAKGKGFVLNRTNGFKALMRAFGKAYLHLAAPGEVVTRGHFLLYFERIQISDNYFTVDYFPPGSTGEARLYRLFTEQEKFDRTSLL